MSTLPLDRMSAIEPVPAVPPTAPDAAVPPLTAIAELDPYLWADQS